MAKQVKTKSIEEALWQSCDKLRGSIEPGEYKPDIEARKKGKLKKDSNWKSVI